MTASITDFSQFTELRRAAGQNSREALAEVAGQFEALFIQSLLKNMREASFGDDLLGGGDQHEMYQGMLDQQLALEMASGKGIGIAEMLVRQLGGEPRAGAAPSEAVPLSVRPPSAAPRLASSAVPAPAEPEPDRGAGFDSPESFVRELWPHVKRVARQLGVEARGILAQAALETGWGRYVPRDASGQSSFNLFGIKADSRWDGPAVSRTTLEFRDGVPQRESARFRAYESIAESVYDYARFLQSNPRYSEVGTVGSDVAAFARSVADAGYATDPDYAAKIERVASSERMQGLLDGLESAR